MIMNTIQIAKIAHEVNKAYCEAIGDNSQVGWDEAPEWQRVGVVDGVEFHKKNPSASASASHGNWLALKTSQGWVYGEAKDPEKKTHPCCVPYDKLPVEQKARDYIFRQIIHSILEVK